MRKLESSPLLCGVSKDHLEKFKANIKQVEFEISNYCNLKCPYCPNSLFSEAGSDDVRYVDMGLYEKVLQELKTIDFAGNFCFHGYNEPLYDYDLFMQALRKSVELIPRAEKCLYTNGMYLTVHRLVELLSVGINFIEITIHFSRQWDKDRQYEKVVAFCKKNGMDDALRKIDVTDASVRTGLNVDGVCIYVKSFDFFRLGQDRGGLMRGISGKKRTTECLLPNHLLNINYRGDVFPCCHIYPRKVNASYIMGSVHTDSIFTIYASPKRRSFIRNAGGISEISAAVPKACAACTETNWLP